MGAVSEPDITRAVAARVSDLMGQHRSIRFSAKVDIEVRVEGEAPLDVIHINLEQVGALLDQIWVELIVPR